MQGPRVNTTHFILMLFGSFFFARGKGAEPHPAHNEQYKDVCIVGAGLSGAVIAERYASQMNQSVLVLEKR